SPEISIKQDADNEVEGMQCNGNGEMRAYHEQSGELQIQAQWGRQLRVTPEPESGTFLIQLERHAVVNQPEAEFSLSADEIRMWVRQTQKTGSEPTPAGSPTSEGWQGSHMK